MGGYSTGWAFTHRSVERFFLFLLQAIYRRSLPKFVYPLKLIELCSYKHSGQLNRPHYPLKD
ncbi:hypothetical protein M23134_00728 [Microscilla marina ATCC 23134]|uniref:Uncharacterized protein n=1 Tax=Microscilla marina ATCC 23134 TaxID=313606 RepID=A1ZS39_MICM2|nr:hypothetical protein M23134_00728 [Microscilla marina ATCC 23134]